MTKNEFNAGLIAITVGVALMMGGSLFSLVVAMAPKGPEAILIPGIGQVMLGFLVVVVAFCCGAGIPGQNTCS